MATFNQFCTTASTLTTGTNPACDVQIGAPEKLIFTDEDFEISTFANALLEATYTAGVEAGTVYPFPLVEEYSNDSEDDTYYTSPLTRIQTFISEGKHGFTYLIKFNPDLHKRLRSGLNGKSKRLIWVDSTNNVVGTSPDGTKFKGWKSGTLRVEKWRPSDGSNLSFTAIKFIAESTLETNDNIAIFPVTWDIKSLNGVEPCTLAVVGTPNATTLVVDITTSEGAAVEGITEATDFQFIEGSGPTEETITVVAESSTVPGRYTLTAVAFVTGTINLNGVVSLAGRYYKGTATAVTIS